MTGVGDRLSWNLTIRRSLFARKVRGQIQPIPRQLLPAKSHLMMVGFSNPKAKPNWWLGGYVSQLLDASPSSTSIFGSFPSASNHRCKLGGLTLIRFPDYGILPFTIQLDIAPWHERMNIEAWWYDGDDPDKSLQSLEQIKSRLSVIETQLGQIV